MNQIFLSYNRQDEPRAKLFADALTRAGMTVWWDRSLRSGESYDEVTEAALRGALAVVVLWSPRSAASRWVRAEATLADRNKTLVPAMIEPCERPIMFELTQTADLSHWHGEDHDRAWQRFVTDVRQFVGAGAGSGAGERALPASIPLAPAVHHGEHGNAPSLAVLPFANRSGLGDDDVFAVGMVEDIIDALSQSVNLRVITSSATARYRSGALPDLHAMARDLGVRYVMEGNVRRAGNLLRVTAQLVEAEGGAILWTQKFERTLAELADLQEDLVLDVAAHLHSQVERVEMVRVLRKPSNLTAWEAVTRASAAYRTINGETLLQAVTEAQRAVSIAPDYGIAHAMLADASATIYMWMQPDDPAEVKRIRGTIDAALKLDPDNAVVLAHVAEAYNYIGRPEDGLALAQRAIQFSPSCGLAHYSAGVAATLLDRVDEAAAHFATELRVAPGSHTLFASYIWRASGQARRGHWEAALDLYAEAWRLNSLNPSICIGEVVALTKLGRHAEARERMVTLREVDPDTPLETWQRCNERWFTNCAQGPEMTEILTDCWNQVPVPA